jgi:uncharacterized membrane protein
MVLFRRTVSRGRGISILLLSLLFVISGTLHFVRLQRYQGIIPGWVPRPSLIVQLSGAAELLGGISLLIPVTRAVAGWGLIAILVAVFPANIEMLRQAHAAGAWWIWQAALWMRLPLQGLLMWWIGWATQFRLCRPLHK